MFFFSSRMWSLWTLTIMDSSRHSSTVITKLPSSHRMREPTETEVGRCSYVQAMRELSPSTE